MRKRLRKKLHVGECQELNQAQDIGTPLCWAGLSSFPPVREKIGMGGKCMRLDSSPPPWPTAALSAAPALAALAAHPAVAEAVQRLDNWDCTSPTGICAEYDASDSSSQLAEPSPAEIEASVAATL